MKKILLLLFLLQQISSNAQERTVTLKGEIKNIPDTAVYVVYDITSGRHIFSDTIRNGKFKTIYTFGKDAELPLHTGIYLSNLSRFRSLYLCEGTTTIKGNGTNVLFWALSNNSEQQKESSAIKKSTLKTEKIIRETEKKIDEIIQLKGKDCEEVKKLDSLQAINHQKVSFDVLDYLQSNPPKSEAGMYEFEICLIDGLYYGTALSERINEIKEIFSGVDEKLQKSNSGRKINSILTPTKELKINDMLIDAEFKNINGSTTKLSDFKGKFMLLDFWNYSCGPCLMAGEELAGIEKTYHTLLRVVGINLDDEKHWKNGHEKVKIEWTNLNDDLGMQGGYLSHFRMSYTPAYVLVAPDGKILDIWHGYGKGSIIKQLKKNNLIP